MDDVGADMRRSILLVKLFFPFSVLVVPPGFVEALRAFGLPNSVSGLINGVPSHLAKITPSCNCCRDRDELTMVWECDLGSPFCLSQFCKAF